MRLLIAIPFIAIIGIGFALTWFGGYFLNILLPDPDPCVD